MNYLAIHLDPPSRRRPPGYISRQDVTRAIIRWREEHDLAPVPRLPEQPVYDIMNDGFGEALRGAGVEAG